MKCVKRLEQRLFEEFGVKELKRAKPRNKRNSVGPPGGKDPENKIPIPKVNHFTDGGPSQQSAFKMG